MREATDCTAGQRTRPVGCLRHPEHYWCRTCHGFYGVPHDDIHVGPNKHPNRDHRHCACRPCREYTAEQSRISQLAEDEYQAERRRLRMTTLVNELQGPIYSFQMARGDNRNGAKKRQSLAAAKIETIIQNYQKEQS